MLCPRCRSVCTEGKWRSRVRRGDKVLWVEALCWLCSSCRTPYGPIQFLTPDLEDRNEALAATAWRETYSEDMPPPMASVRLRRLMRTPEGRTRVARVFGRVLEHKIKERES